MSSRNGRPFTNFNGINLKGQNGLIRFETPTLTPTTTTGERILYVNSSNQLVYNDGSSNVTVGAAGGSGTSLDGAYDNGRTISVNTGTLTMAGVNEDTAVLTLTGDGDSAGALIAFTHTTATRKDINGTASTWHVTGQGNAEFQGKVTTDEIVGYASGSDGNLTIDAKGTGTIGIGATSTGAVTITPALTATASLTISGTAASNVLTITAGDVLLSDASLTIVDADNANSFKMTNNTATTIGASTSTGLVELISTSLTTGTLLNLNLTEAQLNGGFYLQAWDATAVAAVFSIGENGDVVITGTADANALLISNGDVTMSDGKVQVTNQDNEDTLKIINNGLLSASSLDLSGSGTFTGTTTSSFINVAPTGLTTGTALYIIAGSATTLSTLVDLSTSTTTGTALRLTATGVETGVGSALEIIADAATTPGNAAGEGVVKISADGLTTGSALDVTSTSIGMTTGRIADFSSISGSITGTLNKTADFFNISALRTVTTGTVADDYNMLNLVRSNVGNGAGTFTATGAVLYVESSTTSTTMTVADTVNGLEIVMDSGGTGTGVLVTHAATAGRAIDVVSAATSVSDVRITSSGVKADNKATLEVTGSGATATGAAMLRVAHTGTPAGSTSYLAEFDYSGATVATNDPITVQITSGDSVGAALSILTTATTITGGVIDISAAALTTGKVIDMSNLDAITTGKAIHVDATGVTHTDGILVHIDSASTAGTSTGRLLLVDHTGNAGVSTIIAEVLSAAADETVVLQAKASGLLAAGKVLNISGAAVTTGTLLDISDNTAHTTGTGINLVTNSADTGTRTLLNIKNDHASATGTTPLLITQDAPTSTNFKKMMTLGTLSIYISDQTSPNTALTAIEGSICLNGSATGQTFWNTDGSTAWTAFA